MEQICEKTTCTGCGVCQNACPKAAILLREDELGFLHPEINHELCVDCNLCKKVCPVNNTKRSQGEPISYYAAWNKSSQIRADSTSGGVFTEIAKNIISKGGAVFGVAWNEELVPEYRIAVHESEIEGFRGSKYAQAVTNDTYIQVKNHLEKEAYVLFCGTPCQVSGLYNYLGKNYEKLYTIDIVCHGVPSARLLKQYIHSLEHNNHAKSISLRYKNPFWDYSNVRIVFSDGSCYLKPTTDDPYFILFNVGYSLRESCHRCKYANLNRVGDMTLSDFWGYTPSNFKMSKFDKGVSLVMINTSKGNELFASVAAQFVYESATKAMALRSNQTLKMPFAPPEDRVIQFWSDYKNGQPLEELQKKYVPDPMRIPPLLWLRRLVRRYRWLINK